jgi:hypothetical protein
MLSKWGCLDRALPVVYLFWLPLLQKTTTPVKARNKYSYSMHQLELKGTSRSPTKKETILIYMVDEDHEGTC